MSHTAPAGQRSGILISTPLEGGPSIQRDTVSCIHCGTTWIWQPGSGRRRGWCCCCNGIVCGLPACVARGCVHREQLLENLESGKPLDHRPISISVEGTPPVAHPD